MSAREVPSLPASHALELTDQLDRLGVNSEQVLARVGLTRASLESPSARLTSHQFIPLVETSIEVSKAPWLGLLIGMNMRVPAHGFLGFAAMTAPTVRNALELAIRFAPTRSNIVRLELHVEDENAMLFFDEQFDLHSARETILVALMVGVWRIGEFLTGQTLTGRADFAFAEPAYANLLKATPLARHEVRFSEARNALHFPASYLELRFTLANAASFQLAKEQCEVALAALDRAGLERHVRDALPREGGGVCTVEEIAIRLGTSTRTLQRRLKSEGISFSAIAGEIQHRQASVLLRDDKLSIDQVAERVGYSDTSSFSRAFRRRAGMTPAAFRKR